MEKKQGEVIEGKVVREGPTEKVVLSKNLKQELAMGEVQRTTRKPGAWLDPEVEKRVVGMRPRKY